MNLRHASQELMPYLTLELIPVNATGVAQTPHTEFDTASNNDGN